MQPPLQPTTAHATAAHAGRHHELLTELFHELFQTERSAVTHGSREAHRLGDAPPARALRQVAHHAEAALRQLPSLARNHGLPDSHAGRFIGELFSAIRQGFADRVMAEERSYRMTLIGVRHGVDLVRMIERTAQAAVLPDLIRFCAEWLDARAPLVAAVEREMNWFATQPERALRRGG